MNMTNQHGYRVDTSGLIRVSWMKDQYGNEIERWQPDEMAPADPDYVDIRVKLSDRSPWSRAEVVANYWNRLGVR